MWPSRCLRRRGFPQYAHCERKKSQTCLFSESESGGSMMPAIARRITFLAYEEVVPGMGVQSPIDGFSLTRAGFVRRPIILRSKYNINAFRYCLFQIAKS